MKRILVLLPLLAFAAGCMSALAAPGPFVESLTTQTLTQAAPTVATDGLALGGLRGFRVSICVVGGNLAASGNLRAYVYVPSQAHWIHNPDQDLVVTNTGVPCQLFSDRVPSVRKGRVLYVNDTVGVSAGTTATVLIEGAVAQ